MKAYPKYKDSGIERVGEIPDRWEVKRLKFVGSLSSGSGFPHEEQGLTQESIPFYKVADMNLLGNEVFMIKKTNTISKTTLSKLQATLFDKGVIIFPKVGAALLTNKRRILTKPSCVDNNIMGLTVTENNSIKFLYYYLLKEDFSLISNPGAVPSINARQVTEFQTSRPPLPEQTQISKYLDHKTKLIDTLIDKKQKQIELLKEQRTAIINQAVTKGLDPNLKMKNSGIEWLGEIPESWEEVKLKYVVDSVKTGLTPPTSVQKYYNDATFNWFSPGDFNDGMKLLCSKRKINEKALNEGKARFFRKHSVLLVGIGATLGKVGIIEDHGSSNQQIIAITFTDDFDAYFGAYYLKSISDVIISMSNFATLPIFNQTQAKDIFIATPPLGEQKSIVGFIFKIENQTTTYVDKIQQQINLLKEYRTTLISEAVTGKIDVRDEVIQ